MVEARRDVVDATGDELPGTLRDLVLRRLGTFRPPPSTCFSLLRCSVRPSRSETWLPWLAAPLPRSSPACPSLPGPAPGRAGRRRRLPASAGATGGLRRPADPGAQGAPPGGRVGAGPVPGPMWRKWQATCCWVPSRVISKRFVAARGGRGSGSDCTRYRGEATTPRHRAASSRSPRRRCRQRGARRGAAERGPSRRSRGDS